MSGSLSPNQLLVSPAPAPGTTDAYFDTETSLVVAATTGVVIPVGMYLVEGNAHVSVQYSTDGGTTWRTMLPLSTGGVVFSDGVNVRALGDATGGTLRMLPKL